MNKNILSIVWRKILHDSCKGNTQIKRVTEISIKREFFACFVVVFFLSISSAYATDESLSKTKILSFNIPQQRADKALILFAEQANITLFFPFDKVKGKIANQIIGKFSLENALDKLLQDTGLMSSFSKNLTLKITLTDEEKNMGNKRSLLAAMLGFLAGGANNVLAQVDGASGSALTALEEIVVTAQRREQSLQDVPISLIALTSDDLKSRNVNDVTQMTLATPGLSLGTDNTLAIRGVGSLVFTETIDPSVALSVDDVNYGRPSLGGNLFNDIERIEVLYGPQGLLFGKNATAGLLNIITKRPELGEFNGSLEAQIAQRPTTPTDGMTLISKAIVNIPLTESSALRINALISDQEAVTESQFVGTTEGARADSDKNSSSIKFKYLNELSDDLSIYLIADYAEEEGIAGFFDRTYRSTGEGSNTPAILASYGLSVGEQSLSYATDGENFRDLDTGGFQGRINYVFDNGFELVNVAAWRYYDRVQQLDTDYLPIDGVNINSSEANYDQFSNELRIVLPSENRLKGQVGLYYMDSTIESAGKLRGAGGAPGFPVCFSPAACTYDNFDLTLLGSDSQSELQTTSYAIFGQFDYELTDVLTLVIGARLTRDESDFDLLTGQDAEKYIVNLGGTPGSYTDNTTNTNFSWKLGTQYFFSDDVMTYATISTGYKAPGFNESATPSGDLAVDEETVINYELGLKSSWLDNRLRVNASVFHQRFEDYQVQAFDLAAQSFFTQNAAEVTVQGVELAVTAALAPGLTLTNSTSLLDSTFDDFAGALCYPGQLGCDVAGTFNAKDLETPSSAKVSSSTQLMYEFALANGIDAFVEGNWYYRSKTNFQINHAPGAKLDATDIIGLSLGVVTDYGLSASLFCKNCMNEVTPTYIAVDPADSDQFGIATYQQSWGFNSVRTVGMTVKYDF